jgi:hypothetical protein
MVTSRTDDLDSATNLGSSLNRTCSVAEVYIARCLKKGKQILIHSAAVTPQCNVS